MRKWIIGFTTIFLLFLAFNIIPEMRGGWGWRWEYQKPSNWTSIFILVLILLIYLIGVWWIRSRERLLWVGLLWSIAAGFALAVGIQNVRDDPMFMLFSHTVSPVQTGASTVAVQFLSKDGVDESLQNWTDVMHRSDEKNIIHFSTSPPGQPLIHYWIADLFEAVESVSRPLSMALRPYQCSTPDVMEYQRGEIVSAGFGMLMPLWAAFAVIPVFFAAFYLTDDRQVSLRLAQWMPLVPSLLLFAPTWNTLYPLLVVTSFVFFLHSLTRRKIVSAFFAGIAMSLTTFLNFSIFPLFALFGFFTLGYWYFVARKEDSELTWRWIVKIGFVFGLGLSSIWAIFAIYSGVTPFDIMQVTFDQHLDIKRNYYIWLLLHPYDLLMFTGWAIALMAILALIYAIKRIRSKQPLSKVDILALSTAITIISLDLTGITRGESARIWLFFTPFLLLSTGEFFVKHLNRWDIPLLTTQAGTVAIMGAVLPVVAFDMNPLVESPRTDVLSLDHLEMRPLDFIFKSETYEGEFDLSGYRFIADPTNQRITVEFLWEGVKQVERPYQFEVVATADDNGVIRQSEPYRWYPQGGNYLTTCWQKGDQIHDVIIIDVPAVSQPVVWELTIHAIDLRTNEIALIYLGEENVGEATLGGINYP